MDTGASDLVHDAWRIIVSFATPVLLEKLACVSQSLNALVWSTMKRLNFSDSDPEFGQKQLMYYLKKCPNLKSLTAPLFAFPNQPEIIAQCVPNLEEFLPRGLSDVGNPTLRSWTHFKFLKRLRLNCSPYVEPARLKYLFPEGIVEFPTILDLQFLGPYGFGPNVGDSNFLTLFPNLEILRIELWLSFVDIGGIPTSTLEKIKTLSIFCSTGHTGGIMVRNISSLTRCQSLTTLRLDDVRPDSYSCYLSALTTLEYLLLDDTPVGGMAIASLSALTRLRSLDVDRVKFSFEALEPLTQISRLSYCQKGDSPDKQGTMWVLKRHTNLTELDLQFNPENYGHYVSRLTGLTLLDIGGCLTGDNGLYFLKGLTNLTKLSIVECRASNEGWGYLTSLTKLIVISLNDNPKIDDFGLRRLKLFPLLERVDFGGCPLITGRGLDQITNLRNLEYLDLSKTNLRSKYFSYLTKLNLTELDVSKTPIDDYALRFLKDMKSLVRIRLKDCPKITRKGPSGVKDFTRLEWEIVKEKN